MPQDIRVIVIVIIISIVTVTDDDKHKAAAGLHRPSHRPLLLIEHPQVHGGGFHKIEKLIFLSMKGMVCLSVRK